MEQSFILFAKIDRPVTRQDLLLLGTAHDYWLELVHTKSNGTLKSKYHVQNNELYQLKVGVGRRSTLVLTGASIPLCHVQSFTNLKVP